MKYVKVKDKNYLERDIFSNGIVSSDINGYKEYIDNYKRNFNYQQKIKSLESNMNTLKSDIDEIKSLLKKIINDSK